MTAVPPAASIFEEKNNIVRGASIVGSDIHWPPMNVKACKHFIFIVQAFIDISNASVRADRDV